MALGKLLASNFSFRKVRSALTIAAIALAVSLVVAVTSGYSSAEAALQQFVRYYMGAGSIEIAPKGDPNAVFDGSLVEKLAGDAVAKSVVGRLETTVPVAGPKQGSIVGATALAVGVRLPEDAQIAAMKRDAGEWFTGSTGSVAVIDQVMAAKLDIEVGQKITLLHPEHPIQLTVVGIVHKPTALALQAQSVYVPLETLQAFIDRQGKISRIFVELRSDADEDAFAQRWTPTIASMEPELRLRRSGERQREMQRNMEGAQFLSYMGGTVAMLAATFIVFATLSMGVAERTRSLAMLRAVGALKQQIGWLVVLEGVLLATAGALVGVPLGYLWIRILARYHETIFSAGISMSTGGILYGSIGMIAAAVLASFMPAWTAMRVSPLDAMTPLGQSGRGRTPWLAAAIGLPLVTVDPILMFTPGLPRELVFWGHFAFGLPCLFLGFFLLAPAFVWIIERTLGRIIAFFLRLDYALLRQQLSGSLWRAAGTAAALMVGLAILVVLQIQGTTMLSGWRLPNKFPDVFIVAPFGLDAQQQLVLEQTPGIRPGQVLPIAISSPQLGLSLFSIGNTAILPDATMFFGVDPHRAINMIELDYRMGNPQDAERMLKLGRHIIVTNEFNQLRGLKVGDKLPIKTPMSGTVEYTIAAVVWSPGLDVIVSAFDMGRQLEQRTVALVIGSLEDARRDFGMDKVNLFAANLDIGVQRQDLAHRMSEKMNAADAAPGGISTRGLSVSQLRRLLGSSGFLVGDVRHIKYEMEKGLHHLLMLVSTVALAAIAVASLGVTNTIMASIRSRRWQFGILRSVGTTRLQLLRIILAEAILLGLVGCSLGLCAGFLMSVDANALSRAILGYGPPLSIPWNIIAGGAGIIVAVAFFASLWPAISAARNQPLTLLQWGRASA